MKDAAYYDRLAYSFRRHRRSNDASPWWSLAPVVLSAGWCWAFVAVVRVGCR